MSSTQFRQGYNESKPTSRVLKPPGGGTSNIFGPPEPKTAPQQPKTKVNRNESDVFFTESDKSGSSPATTPSAPVKEDSYSRVFGDSSPATAKAQGFNIITGLPIAASASPNAVVPQTKEPSPDPVITEGGATNEATTPSTEAPQPEVVTPSSEQPEGPTRRIQPSTRVLQPPGGHCHKLW